MNFKFSQKVAKFLRGYSKFVLQSLRENNFNFIDFKIDIDNIIDMLPEKVRKVIILHYILDNSIKEISDKLKISKNEFMFLKREGIKKIAEELEKNVSNVKFI